jgi:hypothetical protein
MLPIVAGKKSMVLLDAWPGWKNTAIPVTNLIIRDIPPGCTGLVQPCDLYLFRQLDFGIVH